MKQKIKKELEGPIKIFGKYKVIPVVISIPSGYVFNFEGCKYELAKEIPVAFCYQRIKKV